MARVATASELAMLRSENQFSRLYLAVLTPGTVYTARVNQTFTTWDNIAEITYDTGAGTLADVLPGMTMYIGSSAGLYDYGQVRIRKTPSATKFYIGETSEIMWADDLHLTVVREFNLWPRHVRRVSDVAYMDYDIAYSDQHADFDPVPVIGPPAVAWLPSGGTVDIAYSASDSWVLGGGAIASYAWGTDAATGVWDDATLAAPTLTMDTTGIYNVWCELTTGDGKTFTGYRPLFVFDDAFPPVTQFRLDNCSGDYQTGGWTFRVTLYDEATRTEIRDRSMVVLFAKDYYGGGADALTASTIKFTKSTGKIADAAGSDIGLDVFETGASIRVSGSTSNDGAYTVAVGGVGNEIVVNETLTDEAAGATVTITQTSPIQTSIGPVAGRENVIAVGWLAGETIEWNPNQGSVAFDVNGPQWWLAKITGFPPGVEDVDGAPAAWTEINELTVDKSAWHLLHWRSTATAVMDIILTDDTRRARAFEVPKNNIWAQLTEIAETSILAKPLCDRYGRLYVQIGMPIADPGGGDAPTVMAITKPDWREQVSITRRTVPEVGELRMYGMIYNGGGDADIWGSNSPGHVMAHYGRFEQRDRLLVDDQADINDICGKLAGWLSNEYPVVTIPLGANNRMFDIAPWQYATMSMAAADTERGIIWTAKYLIPRRVTFNWSDDSGTLLTDLECESKPVPWPSVNYPPPGFPSIPPLTLSPWPSPTWPPFPVPPTSPVSPLVHTYSTGQIYISTTYRRFVNDALYENSADSIVTPTVTGLSFGGVSAAPLTSETHYYYLTRTAFDNVHAFRANLDGSGTVDVTLESGTGVGNGVYGSLVLLTEDVAAYIFSNPVASQYEIRSVDFSDSTTALLFAVPYDDGGDLEYDMTGLLTALEYNSVVYIVAIDVVYDDALSDTTAIRYHVYNYTAGTGPSIITHTLPVGVDDVVPTYSIVAVSGSYLVTSYKIDPWVGANYIQIHSVEVTGLTVTTADVVGASECKDIAPSHSAGDCYLLLKDYPASPNDSLVVYDIATGAVGAAAFTDPAADLQIMIASKTLCYYAWGGIVYRADTGAVYASIGSPSWTAGEYTVGKGLCDVLDDINGSVWVFDGVLRGVDDFGNITELTTGIDPTGLDNAWLTLQGDRFVLITFDSPSTWAAYVIYQA